MLIRNKYTMVKLNISELLILFSIFTSNSERQFRVSFGLILTSSGKHRTSTTKK